MDSPSVSLESTQEYTIQEFQLDGQQKFKPKSDFFESFAEQLNRLDIGENNLELTSQEANEELLENTPTDGITPDRWPWATCSKFIRAAATELSALHDLMAVVYDRRYLFLENIQHKVHRSEHDQLASLAAKKSALASAANIIRQGITAARDTGENRFLFDLAELRRRWTISKVGDSIVGDLSFKTVGNQLSGTFTVKKSQNGAAISIPSELDEPSHLLVSIDPPTNSAQQPSQRLKPAKLHDRWVPLNDQLEHAQSVLLSKNIFSHLLVESTQTPDKLIEYSANRLEFSLSDGIVLSISMSGSSPSSSSSSSVVNGGAGGGAGGQFRTDLDCRSTNFLLEIYLRCLFLQSFRRKLGCSAFTLKPTSVQPGLHPNRLLCGVQAINTSSLERLQRRQHGLPVGGRSVDDCGVGVLGRLVRTSVFLCRLTKCIGYLDSAIYYFQTKLGIRDPVISVHFPTEINPLLEQCIISLNICAVTPIYIRDHRHVAIEVSPTKLVVYGKDVSIREIELSFQGISSFLASQICWMQVTVVHSLAKQLQWQTIAWKDNELIIVVNEHRRVRVRPSSSTTIATTTTAAAAATTTTGQVDVDVNVDGGAGDTSRWKPIGLDRVPPGYGGLTQKLEVVFALLRLMVLSGQRKVAQLLEWCKKQTAGYNGVNVTDFSRSWRNGLAFCALVHRFRPDLIDFQALSEKEIFHNNQLAFDVAETHFNVAPLLDAVDMVQLSVPDRLSIVTYVASLYNNLSRLEAKGGPKVRKYRRGSTKPVGSERDALLRRKSSVRPPVARPNQCDGGSTDEAVVDQCAKCHKRVFLFERYYVDNLLYHRTCFRTISLRRSSQITENFRSNVKFFQQLCDSKADDASMDKASTDSGEKPTEKGGKKPDVINVLIESRAGKKQRNVRGAPATGSPATGVKPLPEAQFSSVASFDFSAFSRESVAQRTAPVEPLAPRSPACIQILIENNASPSKSAQLSPANKDRSRSPPTPKVPPPKMDSSEEDKPTAETAGDSKRPSLSRLSADFTRHKKVAPVARTYMAKTRALSPSSPTVSPDRGRRRSSFGKTKMAPTPPTVQPSKTNPVQGYDESLNPFADDAKLEDDQKKKEPNEKQQPKNNETVLMTNSPLPRLSPPASKETSPVNSSTRETASPSPPPLPSQPPPPALPTQPSPPKPMPGLGMAGSLVFPRRKSQTVTLQTSETISSEEASPSEPHRSPIEANKMAIPRLKPSFDRSTPSLSRASAFLSKSHNSSEHSTESLSLPKLKLFNLKSKWSGTGDDSDSSSSEDDTTDLAKKDSTFAENSLYAMVKIEPPPPPPAEPGPQKSPWAVNADGDNTADDQDDNSENEVDDESLVSMIMDGFDVEEDFAQINKHIQQLHDIDIQLEQLERQGAELEEKLKSLKTVPERLPKDRKFSSEETLMDEWLALSSQKNELRIQEKEVYSRYQLQKLVRYEEATRKRLRCLIDMPSEKKTAKLRQLEESLLKNLVEMVAERDRILDESDHAMDQIVEEDQKLTALAPTANEGPGKGKNEQEKKPPKKKKKGKVRFK